MKLFLLIVSIFIYLPFLAHAQSSVILSNDPWPPYILGESGKSPPGGSGVTLIKKIFDQLENVKVKFKLSPWKRVLKEAEFGKVDGIMLILKTDERSEYLDFTIPLFEKRRLLWYSSERYPDGIHWNTLKDLSRYKIGAGSGYSLGSELNAAVKQGVLKVQQVYHIDLAFKMLKMGRIDIIPLNEAVAYDIIKKNGWLDLIVADEKPVSTSVYHMSFSKKSLAKKLIPRINQIITEMKNEGLINLILENKK